jgi:hypothetical protein
MYSRVLYITVYCAMATTPYGKAPDARTSGNRGVERSERRSSVSFPDDDQRNDRDVNEQRYDKSDAMIR